MLVLCSSWVGGGDTGAVVASILGAGAVQSASKLNDEREGVSGLATTAANGDMPVGSAELGPGDIEALASVDWTWLSTGGLVACFIGSWRTAVSLEDGSSSILMRSARSNWGSTTALVSDADCGNESIGDRPEASDGDRGDIVSFACIA